MALNIPLTCLGFDHDDVVVMVDSDMFLVRPFSIVDCLKGYDLVGVRQTREVADGVITYVAPGLIFMDMRTLPNKRMINFEAGWIKGASADVGGHMYYYLKNNPDMRLRLINPITMSTLPDNASELAVLGYDSNTIDLIFDARCFEYYLSGTFIHYYAGGSNWPGYTVEFLEKRNKHLFQFIDKQFSFYA